MLKTALIFQNGMVLQREKDIPIWGTAEPGETITIELGQEKVTTDTNASGEWKALFSPRKAADGLTLTVKGTSEEICFHDVAVGEVWIAGGQSNMEFYLGFECHCKEIEESYENSRVRFFDYPEVAYEGQLEDMDYCNEGFWRYAKKSDLAYFSAVGFYFAKELEDKLHVPIGIVGCNWGGTPACAWMDPARLEGTLGESWNQDYEKDVQDIDMVKFLEDFKKNPLNDRTNMLNEPFNQKAMKIGFTKEEQAAMQKEMENMGFPAFFYERRPGGLYETMLKKIVPYSVRGVIWYQGETDGDFHPDAYADVFTKMIENWRDLWMEELPFLFVQLAPFREWMAVNGKKYGIVRTCQEKVSKSVPNTWMATTGDVGMEWDIHPKNKQPIGERLALLARGHVYHENILCDPPEAVKAIKKDHQVMIYFRNAEGLKIEGEMLRAMQVTDAKGSMRAAVNAEVQEDCLILYKVEDAKEVAFAMEDYCEVNLYNRAHIPAKPFRLAIINE